VHSRAGPADETTEGIPKAWLILGDAAQRKKKGLKSWGEAKHNSGERPEEVRGYQDASLFETCDEGNGSHKNRGRRC